MFCWMKSLPLHRTVKRNQTQKKRNEAETVQQNTNFDNSRFFRCVITFEWKEPCRLIKYYRYDKVIRENAHICTNRRQVLQSTSDCNKNDPWHNVNIYNLHFWTKERVLNSSLSCTYSKWTGTILSKFSREFNMSNEPGFIQSIILHHVTLKNEWMIAFVFFKFDITLFDESKLFKIIFTFLTSNLGAIYF